MHGPTLRLRHRGRVPGTLLLFHPRPETGPGRRERGDGPTNDAACAGSGLNRPGEADDGAFAEEADGMFNSLIPRPPAWCRDGLSNTVIVGERTLVAGGPDDPAGAGPPDPQRYITLVLPPANVTETNCLLNTPPGAGPAGTNRFGASRGRIGAGQAFENTQYNYALPPNGERFDCHFRVSRGLMAARSFHPGGVNVALATAACGSRRRP